MSESKGGEGKDGGGCKDEGELGGGGGGGGGGGSSWEEIDFER